MDRVEKLTREASGLEALVHDVTQSSEDPDLEIGRVRFLWIPTRNGLQ